MHIPSILWVPRGVCKEIPKKVSVGFGESSASANSPTQTVSSNDQLHPTDTGDDTIEARYDLDNYDADDPAEPDSTNVEGESKDVDLGVHACFASIEDDPLVTVKHDSDDDDDVDSFNIRPTDNLLVMSCVDSCDDVSLQVHVYNNIDLTDVHFYCHREYFMESIPLCLELVCSTGDAASTPADATETSGFEGNAYVGAGCMDSKIRFWDLDVVDSLAPSFSLNSKKRVALSHSGAILDLHMNPLLPHILGSASADTTIGVWDLCKCEMASKVTGHKKEVASLRWHTVESALVLSGGMDARVLVSDCRQADTTSALKWQLTAPASCVVWASDLLNPFCFLAAAEDGSLVSCDTRQPKKLLSSTVAHEGEVAFLSAQRNYIVTAGAADSCVKFWTMTALVDGSEVSSPALLRCKELASLDGILTAAVNPNCPTVMAFGGKKDSHVWNAAEDDVVASYLRLKQL